MSRSRKGLALIETFLVGAVVTVGAVIVLTPYADNVGQLIRNRTTSQAGTVHYGTPVKPVIYPNNGPGSNATSQVGSCDNLTLQFLRSILSDAQYQYIISLGLTPAALNATVNWTAPDGQVYTYPKYIIGQYADTSAEKNSSSTYYLYAFSGNPGNIGFVPGASNSTTVKDSAEGYKQYYAMGASYPGDGYGDPSVSGVFDLSHPWLQPSQDNSTSNDSAAWVASMNFNAGSHCPAFNYFSTPLILDINGDGKISAKAGIGVDIDGDGRPDGAAVDGDKMLAMNPMYGDKKITGKEVFGDHTIDPFSGTPLKAKNGFIALKQIAINAEKRTGIKCLDDTYADVRKINAALKKAKKGKIGLISGNNVTLLEPLGKVAKINTNYTQVAKHSEDTADIKHRQVSNWLDIKNISHVIHDVWFALKHSIKKLATNIAKIFS